MRHPARPAWWAMWILLIAVISIANAYEGDREGASGETDVPDAIREQVHDAWIEGKIEMALLLNRYLSGLGIDASVKAGEVALTGTVASDIDSDLAEQIALGISGVKSVENELKIDASATPQGASADSARHFREIVEDLTLTAQVKSKLILNRNVNAANIDVDTANSVVTLNGQVSRGQERDLVVQIARNTRNVRRVVDHLRIEPAT